MKSLQNIFSLLILAIFLVPTTGFYYNKRSCLISDDVQFEFDGDYTCCTEDAQAQCEADTVKECCTYDGDYLKTDEDYTSPARPGPPHIEILLTLAYHSHNFFPDPQFTPEENIHSPPLIISSKDILLRHGAMLI